MKKEKSINIQIRLSKDEIDYLKLLLEDEIFKLQGLRKLIKKSEVTQTLDSAEAIKRKVDSPNFSFK